jgi:hypothetical protein
VTSLKDTIKQLSHSFLKLQNFVEQKVTKMEMENAELKNKLLQIEKV